MKNSIVDAVIMTAQQGPVRKVLCAMLKKIVFFDFPANWPALPEQLNSKMGSGDSSQTIGAL